MGTNSQTRPPELSGIGTRSYYTRAATATVAGCQNVTVSGTSAPTTHPVNATEVMLCSSTACYVTIGDAPTAVAGAGFMLPANLPFHVQCLTTDKIAAIQFAAGGTLTVTAVNQ